MSETNDRQIDRLIRAHLQRELDAHVGAASRKFTARVAASTASPGMTVTSGERPRRHPRDEGPRFGSFWTIGLVGTALAATLMIVSMRHVTRPPTGRSPLVPPGGDSLPVTPAAYSGEGNVAWRTIDQGVVRLSDGTSARRFLQKRTDSILVTDPKTKRTFEYVKPHEQTVYVSLKQH